MTASGQLGPEEVHSFFWEPRPLPSPGVWGSGNKSGQTDVLSGLG